ncbi:MAG TPA: tape measure protein [Pseudoduganella sp.]
MNDMRRQVGGSFDDIKDRAASLKSVLVNVFAGVAVGAMAKQFVETADAMALMDARLKQTTGDAESFKTAQAEIYRIAQANNAGLQETAELFTKMNEPVKRLGGGVKETAAIVDAFSTSMRLGGASTQEASAATLQFAQAMGSGKLQGDEFRSIAEASPRFMKAMADGMGVPIEKLKEMGGEGKLTADVVGNALIKSLGQLKSEAGNMPDTVGGAFQRLKNDVMVAVSELNKNSGLTLGIAELISAVNELVPTIKDELAGAFEAVGGWISRNRDGIIEIWGTAKGVLGDVWELAKGFASVLGFVLEVGVKSGAFKTVLETARFLIAGLQDGVKIIGASFALAGADIIDFFTTPLQGVLKLIGTLADKVGLDFGKSLISVADGMDQISKDARKYGDSVFEAFKNGDTAVNRLNAELKKNKEAADAASAGTKVASEVMDALAGTAGKAAGTLVTLKNKNSEATKEQQAAIKEYEKLMQAIKDKTGGLIAETQAQAKLSDGQKTALKVMQDIQAGTLKLTGEQKKSVTAALELLLATEQVNDERKEEAKLLKEMEEQRQKDVNALNKQADELEKLTRKQEDENLVARGVYKTMGELEVARLREQRATLAQIVATEDLLGYCNDETEAHRRTLDALNDLIAAREDGVHLQAAKESADEWKKTAGAIEQSLTDSLMRGFENGKGFGESLVDGLKNTFKSLVLQPTIKAVMSPVSDAIGSLFGGGSGGGSNIFGGIFSGIQSMFGSGASAGAGAGASSGAGGAFGGAASVAGWIAAGMALNDSLYKQGWDPNNGTMNALGKFNPWTGPSVATDKVLQAFGLDDRTASLLSGSATVARLFGRKNKEITEAGIYGGIGSNNFSGVSYENWSQKGGVFRSDRSGTDGRDLDSARDSMLDAMAKEMLSSVTNLADLLELPVGNLGNIVTEARIKLTGDAEKDQQAIADVFVKYRDTLAASYSELLTPFQNTGEALYDTLSRLAGIQISRETLNAFGGIFSDIASGSTAAIIALGDLAGGIDALVSKASAFVKDFYTEQEQGGIAARGILEQLRAVGLEGGGLSSKEEYRALLEGLDVNNAGQREQINTLLTLGPQFAQLSDFMAENSLSLQELAEFAPVIAALDPMFAAQTAAVQESTTAIDATTAAVDSVAAAVQSGTTATVAAINGLSGTIAAAVASASAASNAAIATMSNRLDQIEANNRLAAAAPY